MTLERSAADVAFTLDPPAQGDLAALRSWCADMFARLELVQRQPRPVSIMLSLLQPGDPAFTKPADGLLVFAAATATGVGSPQGVYVRTGGAWVQL